MSPEGPLVRHIVDWVATPALASFIESYSIRYRQLQPDGFFGDWVVVDSNIPKDSFQYDLDLRRDSVYDIQVEAQISIGDPIEVFRDMMVCKFVDCTIFHSRLC